MSAFPRLATSAEKWSDLKLMKLSLFFSLELVRHEVSIQAAADGCGLDL